MTQTDRNRLRAANWVIILSNWLLFTAGGIQLFKLSATSI